MREEKYNVELTSKEKYVEPGGEMDMIVNNTIYVYFDYKGYLVATNRQPDSNSVRFKTRSVKDDKMMRCIKDAIAADKAMRKLKEKEKKTNQSNKENLENILGYNVKEHTERHGYGQGRSYHSYETKHFSIEGQEENQISKIKISVYDNKEGKSYVVSGIPALTPEKLKKLVKLIES